MLPLQVLAGIDRATEERSDLQDRCVVGHVTDSMVQQIGLARLLHSAVRESQSLQIVVLEENNFRFAHGTKPGEQCGITQSAR